MTSEATVYIHLPGQGYVPAGILEYLPSQKRSLFGYGRRYVKRPNALPPDPVRLPLSFTGQARTPRNWPMFNVFRDAAPDKWGRKVLRLQAGRAAHTLSEFDILTAVFSPRRIGALAFGPDPTTGPKSMAPWADSEDLFSRNMEQLRQIAEIIKVIEQTPEDELDTLRDRFRDEPFWQALTSIFSVGGARPKAMIELDGQQWIAKFPKADDVWNEPLVEHATMTLAGKTGINVAPTRVLKIGEITVLLVKRFDRDENGEPRHFVSGFTVRDVGEEDDWGSYQDLALAARRLGDETVGEKLFRRMVFNAMCANTDDHLRNHAFFVGRNHVSLTPAFDIVPRAFRATSYDLALRCGTHGTQTTKQNLLSRTEPFGLAPRSAARIQAEMADVVSGWREHFSSLGVTKKDIRELAHRFRQFS